MPINGSTNFSGRPIWAEISLGAVRRNLAAIRRLINSDRPSQKPRKVMSIVKANAYGHGAVPIVKALAKAGADWFGVACVSEGAELRNAGIRQPILILGGYWPGEEKALVEFGLSPAVTNCSQLPLLERAAAKARHLKGPLGFHLKINTGMNRLGIAPKDIDCFVRAASKCSHLKLQGTFTHFASSELLDTEETTIQGERFAGVLLRMKALGLPPGLVHMANSAAIAARPDTWGDMVRPGAATYGYHPNYSPPRRQEEIETRLALEPVLSLRTRIIAIRDVEPGDGVGYNARFVASKPSRIAVIAAGYADGLMRGLSSRGSVIVRGQYARIVGNISMDMATIDVSDVAGSAVGDIVTIYGTDGPLSRTAADLSLDLGTVVQDVLCAIGSRVRRFCLDRDREK
jgi:alanine racemase